MTSELTPTEVIATRLFGWKRLANEDPTTWHSGMAFSDGLIYISLTCGMPDFSDCRLKWYWVRRMEDAIEELEGGKYSTFYQHCLADIWDSESGPQPELFTWRNLLSVVTLRATVEQRLAASLKVLGEAGL